MDKWKRLGNLLIARRVKLGYPKRSKFALERGFRNDRVLAAIENAERTNFSVSTLRQVEVAYEWANGSIDRVLAGGEPEAADRSRQQYLEQWDDRSIARDADFLRAKVDELEEEQSMLLISLEQARHHVMSLEVRLDRIAADLGTAKTELTSLDEMLTKLRAEESKPHFDWDNLPPSAPMLISLIMNEAKIGSDDDVLEGDEHESAALRFLSELLSGSRAEVEDRINKLIDTADESDNELVYLAWPDDTPTAARSGKPASRAQREREDEEMTAPDPEGPEFGA